MTKDLPSPAQPRTRQLNIRLNEAEYKALEAYARTLNMNKSDFARQSVIQIMCQISEREFKELSRQTPLTRHGD